MGFRDFCDDSWQCHMRCRTEHTDQCIPGIRRRHQIDLFNRVIDCLQIVPQQYGCDLSLCCGIIRNGEFGFHNTSLEEFVGGMIRTHQPHTTDSHACDRLRLTTYDLHRFRLVA